MEITAPVAGSLAGILAPEALAFVEKLVREFEPARVQWLARRVGRQREMDHGALPDFLAETRHIRDDQSWRVASIPADLLDRRTEITGPVDRKFLSATRTAGNTS